MPLDQGATELYETAWNLACVRQLTPSLCWTLRVLRVVSLDGPQKGPGEGEGMPSVEYLAMVSPVTYAARGPVNWETRALSGFLLQEGHQESAQKKARLGNSQ
jgi:hypothetical protein